MCELSPHQQIQCLRINVLQCPQLHCPVDPLNSPHTMPTCPVWSITLVELYWHLPCSNRFIFLSLYLVILHNRCSNHFLFLFFFFFLAPSSRPLRWCRCRNLSELCACCRLDRALFLRWTPDEALTRGCHRNGASWPRLLATLALRPRWQGRSWEKKEVGLWHVEIFEEALLYVSASNYGRAQGIYGPWRKAPVWLCLLECP